MKEYKNLGGGSTAKPATPMSKATGAVPTGNPGSYNPSAAAKALNQPAPKC